MARPQSFQSLRPRALWRLAVLIPLGYAIACGGGDADPLAQMDIPVSGGAAAGYVPDDTCARCHSDLFRAYQEVGMAQSFSRPRADRLIEEFGGEPFYHRASDRYYRMRRDGERIVFERYQLDGDGEPIHRVELEVDWLLGSGHTSRSYLVQAPGGELAVLPIAWYSQTSSWGMAPGFDSAGHLGLERRAYRECLFCHNAYPDVPAGSDAYGKPHVFPTDLPEGIGCQRCHGPGAEHVRAALDGDGERVRSSVFNPAGQPPERAVDLCYSCHFQPSVALMGLRRFGRTVYSHRPDEPLDDYLVQLDVEEAGLAREDRFEINHHPYRFEQSTCFVESPPGSLTCLTCHDPHQKVRPSRRREHFRDACLACHAVDSCSLEAMGGGTSLPRDLVEAVADDCVACHMPRRRTQDVVHVVMTDHRIVRRPGGEERLAPRAERVPVLTDARFLPPLPDLSPAEAGIYRASAVVRAGGNPEAVDYLVRTVGESSDGALEPQLDLLRALLPQRRFEEADAVATRLLERWPDTARAYEWRSLARARLGRHEEALEDLAAALSLAGDLPEPLFNRGLVQYVLGRDAAAADSLRRAVQLRPLMPRAWVYLGLAELRRGRTGEAESALRQSLALDPTHSGATVALGRLLLEEGRHDEAVSLLEHGARVARDSRPIVALLAELGAATS